MESLVTITIIIAVIMMTYRQKSMKRKKTWLEPDLSGKHA